MFFSYCASLGELACVRLALTTYRLYAGSLLHTIVMIIHYYSYDNSILNSYGPTLYLCVNYIHWKTPYCCLIKGVIFKTYVCGLAWKEHDTQLIIDAIESGRFTHKFYMYMFVIR